jgi:peptide methionine sulfoxide reductase msrA/msrB
MRPHVKKRRDDVTTVFREAGVGNRKLLHPLLLSALLLAAAPSADCAGEARKKLDWKKLIPAEAHVIVHQGTEPPFSGVYTDMFAPGTYDCKRCGARLYASATKFHSGCGWPSFDEAIPGAVTSRPDADGVRTEIVCASCGAHLGHVFRGEGLTPKNTRHCVNSIAMAFVPAAEPARAVFASGCFWGTEYQLKKLPGVISVRAGYSGGHKAHPTYKEVCTGTTGHVEAVEVTYDPALVSYEELARRFFETHDFTQVDGQGPDIGPQYRSVVFYADQAQKETAGKLIRLLTEKGYKVATRLEKAAVFWPAEAYHQDYYARTGGTPYCHLYRKIF